MHLVYPAHHDQMVAAFVACGQRALQARAVFMQERDAALAHVVIQLRKLVHAAAREQARQVILIVAQHVDGEMPALVEGVKTAGFFVDAPEDQRWLQGDGVEAAHRHAHRFSGDAAGRHNGHTRGELTEHLAQVQRLHGVLSFCNLGHGRSQQFCFSRHGLLPVSGHPAPSAGRQRWCIVLSETA